MPDGLSQVALFYVSIQIVHFAFINLLPCVVDAFIPQPLLPRKFGHDSGWFLLPGPPRLLVARRPLELLFAETFSPFIWQSLTPLHKLYQISQPRPLL